jgi:CHAT domain-containing protein
LRRLAAQQLGRNEEALDWLGRGLRLARASRFSSQTSLALMTGARIALFVGEPKLARVLIEEAVFQTDVGAWDTAGPSYLLLYGQALRAEGAPAAARASFEAALQLAMLRGGRNYSAALYELARLDLSQGKAAEAEARLEQAFAEIFTGRSQIPAEMHKLAFLATADDIADLYFSVLQQRQVSAETLLNAVEAWRLQVFREIYRSEPVDYSKSARTLADIQDKLATNTAYVTYHIGNNASFAVLVQSRTQAVIPLAVRRDALHELGAIIRHFLNPDNKAAGYFIRQDRIPPELYRALRDAYDYLIAPLKLGDSVERLLVAPDEVVTELPWNALALPPRGVAERMRVAIGRPITHPMAERVAITMVPSGRLLSHHELRPAAPALLLEASAAVSGGQLAATLSGMDRTVLEDLQLQPLTHAKGEIETAVSALRKQNYQIVVGLTDPLSAVADGVVAIHPVSADLFRHFAPRSSIIHVAAHGLFNPVVPMHSIIIFDAKSSQGLVRAQELLSLNLSSNELVTLSACQTGRADLRTGGEALGFVRGLLGAGAKRVILADWSIHDQTTKLFFEAFYRELADAGDAEEAFQKATKAVYKEHVHPYYWAPMRMFSVVVP